MTVFGQRFASPSRPTRWAMPPLARVEGPFNWIENNFLNTGLRRLGHLERKADAWCDKVNGIHSSNCTGPARAFCMEQPRLKPLPIFVPEVYQLLHRLRDWRATCASIAFATPRPTAHWPLLRCAIEGRVDVLRRPTVGGPRHRRSTDPWNPRDRPGTPGSEAGLNPQRDTPENRDHPAAEAVARLTYGKQASTRGCPVSSVWSRCGFKPASLRRLRVGHAISGSVDPTVACHQPCPSRRRPGPSIRHLQEPPMSW